MDGDLLFWMLVTAILLVLAFAVGHVLYRFKNMRFTQAWQPLVPIVGGTTRGDGGGAATSWLDGTYQGMTVHASMSPNLGDKGGTGSATSGYDYNAFQIVLVGTTGGADWSVKWRNEAFHVVTDDSALRDRLVAHGVVDLVGSLGYPSPAIVNVGLPVVQRTALDGYLHFREDAGPVWLSTPQRFQEELDTLVRVAEIDAQVNPR